MWCEGGRWRKRQDDVADLLRDWRPSSAKTAPFTSSLRPFAQCRPNTCGSNRFYSNDIRARSELPNAYYPLRPQCLVPGLQFSIQQHRAPIPFWNLSLGAFYQTRSRWSSPMLCSLCGYQSPHRPLLIAAPFYGASAPSRFPCRRTLGTKDVGRKEDSHSAGRGYLLHRQAC